MELNWLQQTLEAAFFANLIGVAEAWPRFRFEAFGGHTRSRQAPVRVVALERAPKRLRSSDCGGELRQRRRLQVMVDGKQFPKPSREFIHQIDPME